MGRVCQEDPARGGNYGRRLRVSEDIGTGTCEDEEGVPTASGQSCGIDGVLHTENSVTLGVSLGDIAITARGHAGSLPSPREAQGEEEQRRVLRTRQHNELLYWRSAAWGSFGQTQGPQTLAGPRKLPKRRRSGILRWVAAILGIMLEHFPALTKAATRRRQCLQHDERRQRRLRCRN